jgi:hypothetical protein
MLHLLPYYGLSLTFIGFVAAALYSQRKAIRLTARGWDDLVARIECVEFASLKVVAQDYLDPRDSQIKLEPRELWKLVGGYEGLRRMRSNADLMLALAAHAQDWNFDEATIVAERMRLDASRLRRALLRIELGSLPYFVLRRFWLRIPIQVQEAAAAYYLMRQRLLSLYATSHSGRYPRLAEVL